MEDLLYLYLKCLTRHYTEISGGGSYAVEQNSGELYIYFECSNGFSDWINNFDFPARPYKNMPDTWFCHRGFKRVWRSLEPHLEEIIKRTAAEHITVVGYSHGAALAGICHEYIWYNRPDMRGKIDSFGFGAPRFFWGKCAPVLACRWERFTVIRNLNDIVTHMPPAVFGFTHMGNIKRIGGCRKYNAVTAHQPLSYIKSLSDIAERTNACERVREDEKTV